MKNRFPSFFDAKKQAAIFAAWKYFPSISSRRLGAGVAHQQGYRHADYDAHECRYHPQASSAAYLASEMQPAYA